MNKINNNKERNRRECKFQQILKKLIMITYKKCKKLMVLKNNKGFKRLLMLKKYRECKKYMIKKNNKGLKRLNVYKSID